MRRTLAFLVAFGIGLLCLKFWFKQREVLLDSGDPSGLHSLGGGEPLEGTKESPQGDLTAFGERERPRRLVQGRLVAPNMGMPLDGFAVELRGHVDLLDRSTSDYKGAFQLSASGPPPWRARLVLKRGWRCRRPELRIVDDSAVIEFFVEPLQNQRINGRLVDDATGEPIPGFHFALMQDGKQERAETGLAGTFVSAETYSEGPLAIMASDAFDSQSTRVPLFVDLVFPEYDSILDFPIAVGPTYRLIVVPSNPGDLCAGLLPTARIFDPSMLSSFSPVRETGGLWVRFPRLQESPTFQVRDLKLVVSTRDMRLIGEARVACTQGQCPMPVAVDLTPNVVLDIRVLSREGQRMPGIGIHLVGERLERLVMSGKDGTVTLNVEPGSYRCRVADGPGVHQVADIDVFEPGPIEAVIHLGRETGTLQGTVRSESGLFNSETHIVLREHDSGTRRQLRVAWNKEVSGDYVGTFEEDELPRGTYTAELLSGSSTPRQLGITSSGLPDFRPVEALIDWQPKDLVVAAPSSSIDFVIRDGGPRRSLGFQVVDESGTEIAPFWGFYRTVGGWRRLPGRGSNGTTVFSEVAEDRELEWIIASAGYRIARGDKTAFQIARVSLLLAPVVLEKGWAMAVQVADPHGLPISRALVTMGDCRIETDSNGWAFLSGTGPWAYIRVQRSGFEAVDTPAGETTGYRFIQLRPLE